MQVLEHPEDIQSMGNSMDTLRYQPNANLAQRFPPNAKYSQAGKPAYLQSASSSFSEARRAQALRRNGGNPMQSADTNDPTISQPDTPKIPVRKVYHVSQSLDWLTRRRLTVKLHFEIADLQRD